MMKKQNRNPNCSTYTIDSDRQTYKKVTSKSNKSILAEIKERQPIQQHRAKGNFKPKFIFKDITKSTNNMNHENSALNQMEQFSGLWDDSRGKVSGCSNFHRKEKNGTYNLTAKNSPDLGRKVSRSKSAKNKAIHREGHRRQTEILKAQEKQRQENYYSESQFQEGLSETQLQMQSGHSRSRLNSRAETEYNLNDTGSFEFTGAHSSSNYGLSKVNNNKSQAELNFEEQKNFRQDLNMSRQYTKGVSAKEINYKIKFLECKKQMAVRTAYFTETIQLCKEVFENLHCGLETVDQGNVNKLETNEIVLNSQKQIKDLIEAFSILESEISDK